MSKSKILIFTSNSTNYEAVADYKVAESEVYAHLLVIGNKIFVKDEEMLTC